MLQFRPASPLLALLIALPSQAQYDEAKAARSAGDDAGARRAALVCARGGDARCMLLMASLSRPANDTPAGGWREALGWYRQAAVAGNALGARGVAEMHLNGFGVTKDERPAVRWFARAVEAGDTGSLLTLGQAYAYGLGVERDLPSALGLMQAAASRKVAGADADTADLRARVGDDETARAAAWAAAIETTGKVQPPAATKPAAGPFFFGAVVAVRDPTEVETPNGTRFAAIGLHATSPRAARENACRSVYEQPFGDEAAYTACVRSETSRECANGGYFAVAEATFVIGSVMLDKPLDMRDNAVGMACGRATPAAARAAAIEACRSAQGAPGDRFQNAALVVSARGTRQYDCSIRAAGLNDGRFNGAPVDVSGIAGARTVRVGIRREECWGTSREHDPIFRPDACPP